MSNPFVSLFLGLAKEGLKAVAEGSGTTPTSGVPFNAPRTAGQQARAMAPRPPPPRGPKPCNCISPKR